MAAEIEEMIAECRKRMAAIRAELIAIPNAPVVPLASFTMAPASDEAAARFTAIMANDDPVAARHQALVHCAADQLTVVSDSEIAGAVQLRRLIDVESCMLLWAQRRATRADAEVEADACAAD